MRNKVIITINGQVRGGKNNMIVTRSGLHFPRKSWAIWRDDAVRQVREQTQGMRVPITQPCTASVIYTAGDRRRRDMPAVMDAVWHVLERSGVVEDDSLICGIERWVTRYDKYAPGIVVTIDA